MSAQKDYVLPGDALLRKIQLINFDNSEDIDVRILLNSLDIVESVFSNCMHGKITLFEGIGHHQLLPIIGEETLDVDFATSKDSAKFSRKFNVYGMSNLVIISDHEQAYELFFYSPEFMNNETLRVRRAYKDKTVSDIVSNLHALLKSDLPAPYVAQTANLQNIVVANKKPLEAINYLTKYARSPKYDGSVFVYFENNRGFQFISLQELMDKPPKATYNTIIANLGDKSAGAATFGIEKLDIPFAFDILNNMSFGMYANKVIAYDSVAKKVTETNFNYADQFNQIKHVDAGFKFNSDKFKFSDSSAQVKLVYSRSPRNDSKYFKANNVDQSTYSKSTEDILPARLSIIKQLSNVELEITVPGNTDLAAGDMIMINLPPYTFEQDTKNRVNHKFYNGKYLIVSIKHHIRTGSYRQVLSLVRDVYTKQPTNEK